KKGKTNQGECHKSSPAETRRAGVAQRNPPLSGRGSWRGKRCSTPPPAMREKDLPRAVAEQQVAVGGHRGGAAGGVMGQDRHHVAADFLERVAVIDPAGAG